MASQPKPLPPKKPPLGWSAVPLPNSHKPPILAAFTLATAAASGLRRQLPGWPTGLPPRSIRAPPQPALQGSSAGSVVWQRRVGRDHRCRHSGARITVRHRHRQPTRSPLGRARGRRPALRTRLRCARGLLPGRRTSRACGRRSRPASEAEPVEPADPVVSAAAMAGNDAIAAPTPSATASAPTRPRSGGCPKERASPRALDGTNPTGRGMHAGPPGRNLMNPSLNRLKKIHREPTSLIESWVFSQEMSGISSD